MTGAAALYTRRFSRRYPGLFIILLDQSRSMLEEVEGQNCSKADFATTALNELIAAMVDAAPFDDETGDRKKYAYLSVLGYSDQVHSLLTQSGTPIDIPYLGKNPRGVTRVTREVLDAHTGRYREVEEDRFYWIEPRTYNSTCMDKALMRARDIVREWLIAPPESGQAPRTQCFPPVIIHITDGEHNGLQDPVAIAAEIRSEGTLQGPTLIFTCHFTARMQQPCVFPPSADDVAHLNAFAARLFEMSSVIPEPLRLKAREVAGRDVLPGARGLIYNGDTGVLLRFLNWGTIGTSSSR